MPNKWKQCKVTQPFKACQALHSFKASGTVFSPRPHGGSVSAVNRSDASPAPLHRCLGARELWSDPSNCLGLFPHLPAFYFKILLGVSGWLGQLNVWFQLRSWSQGSWVRAPSQALCWWCRAYLEFSLSLSLSLSLPLPNLRSFSVSK